MDIRSKNAIIKAFSIAAACFSMSILFISICFALAGVYIAPINLIKIWATFFVLGIITVARIMIDSSKWALSKPFYVKNIIFMPLYLVISLTLALNLAKEAIENSGSGLFRLSLIILYAAIFLVTFTIRQLIEYYIRKKKTDEMNDALQVFQKEHSWDEEE